MPTQVRDGFEQLRGQRKADGGNIGDANEPGRKGQREYSLQGDVPTHFLRMPRKVLSRPASSEEERSPMLEPGVGVPALELLIELASDGSLEVIGVRGSFGGDAIGGEEGGEPEDGGREERNAG